MSIRDRSISGRTMEECAVWQTLGEGNEDMVEWIVLCAALNLIDEEIVKAAERNADPTRRLSAPINSAPLIAQSASAPMHNHPQPPPKSRGAQFMSSAGPRLRHGSRK